MSFAMCSKSGLDGGPSTAAAEDVAEALAGVLPGPLQITRTARSGGLRGTDYLPHAVLHIRPGNVDASRGAGFADKQDQELNEFNVLLELLREELLLLDE